MASHAVVTPRSTGSSVLAVRLATAIALVAVWEITSRSGLFYQGAIPSIVEIVRAGAEMLVDGNFYRMLAVTAYEVILALAIGGVIGLSFGLLFGIVKFASAAYEPYVFYFGTTPKIILMPIIIMWFGIGYGSKIAMGALSCFIPIVLGTAAAIRLVSKTYVRVGKSFRLSPLQMIINVYLPATRSSIINSFRIGFGISIVGVLLAETKISAAGLGFQVMEYYRQYDMPSMYALIIIICLGAALINGLMSQSASS